MKATHQTQFEVDATCPSIAVVEAISDVLGEDPMELPPLFEAIDPDALDALLQPSHHGDVHEVTVSFEYDGMIIEVNGDGQVVVRDDRPATDRD